MIRAVQRQRGSRITRAQKGKTRRLLKLKSVLISLSSTTSVKALPDSRELSVLIHVSHKRGLFLKLSIPAALD
jgi:hypothetical protein